MANEYVDRLNLITSEELCHIQTAMDSSYSIVRTQEAVIGNLVADAIKEALDADVAIISGGIIRGNKSYPEGCSITVKDLYAEMPFGNLNVLVEISGQDIVSALENGLYYYEGKAGRFPQVSGLQYAFDPSQPAGARLIDVHVAGQSIVLDKMYKVATVDYMFFGGDGYNSFKEGRLLVSPLREMSTISSVIDYLKKNQGVISGIEKRIVPLLQPTTLDDLFELPSSQ
jgi:2',3'-cyclic-nucleotide 2'-phosphodiesterase (5'-nucleotidase family)